MVAMVSVVSLGKRGRKRRVERGGQVAFAHKVGPAVKAKIGKSD